MGFMLLDFTMALHIHLYTDFFYVQVNHFNRGQIS